MVKRGGENMQPFIRARAQLAGIRPENPQQGDLEHLSPRRRIDEVEDLGRALIAAKQRQQTPRGDMLTHLFGWLQGDASPESAAVNKAGQ